MSGGAKPVGSGEGAKFREVKEGELERPPKDSPASIPVSSIKVESLPDTLKRDVAPLAMQGKALSILSTKSSVLSGAASMQSAMPAIGSLFLGVNLPVGILNVYTLVKNWDVSSGLQRGIGSAEVLANTLLASAGVSLLLARIPALAKLLGPAHAMAATKAAFILGPVGMGLFSLLSMGMGAISTKEAISAEKSRSDALDNADEALDGSIGKELYTREANRFSIKRDFAIVNAVKFFLLGIGVGLGAAVMAGLIVGVAATPLGWVAVGLIGAGFAISIGTLAVRRAQAKSKEQKEEALINRIIDEDYTVPDEILDTSLWPGIPTLRDKIDRRRQYGVE